VVILADKKKILSAILNFLEDFWVKHSLWLCVVLGIVTGVLHYIGWITNIRSSTSNVVTFASIVIGIMGVFLTLIITLQESPVFKRLGQYLPAIQTKLYLSLRSQINYGLSVVILSILINSMPAAPEKYLASIGVTIWFTLFWLMTLGSFYSVKLITDLIVKNFNIDSRKSRQ
jgi:hypothetical protein